MAQVWLDTNRLQQGTRMKRLFALRNKNRTLVKDDSGQPVYFTSKDAARVYRANLTSDISTYFITLGVDHKLYKGE
jgi:hypothetical protein